MTDPLRSAIESALGCQYDILRPLGRGGMGVVYLARERSLERLVAIKVLLPASFSTAGSRERFQREARTVAALAHPNIVPLYTFGEVDDIGYYVMGYVRGDSAAERLRLEGRLSHGEARRIVAELADALDYAHRHGVVHRDIKPANVLIDDESGRPMLADFGIAKMPSTGESLTATGAAIGTPGYMSPEQAVGAREIDGRSDIYSLGVLAYAMIAGREPFVGENAQQIMFKHVMEEPPLLRSFAAGVPEDLESAVMRCLSKDVNDRWQDARSLMTALGHELGEDASTPQELRDMPGFGSWAVVWALAWSAIAIVNRDAPLTAVICALFALIVPAGFLLHVASMQRKGLRVMQIVRVSFWPPKWWGMWWPRALRRPGDLWMRLPLAARAARLLLSAFLIAVPLAIILDRRSVWELAGGAPVRAIALAVLVLFTTGTAAVLIAVIRWAHVRGLPAREIVRLLCGPTTVSASWMSPTMARLLVAAPAATEHVVVAAAPDSPHECVRAVARIAQSLTGSAREVGTLAATTARQLLGEIDILDAEIGALARDGDPEEIPRLEQRLAGIAATNVSETVEQAQMRRLVAEQLELLRLMSTRLDVATRRRAHLAQIQRAIWSELSKLSAAAPSAGAESQAIYARVRDLCAGLEERPTPVASE
ncbi:MAG: serine/threonine-protein kinase [Gemmatimonadaceae bacterium]